jgi:putative transposase
LARSAVYRKPAPVKKADLELMQLIDKLHLERPFFGARKIGICSPPIFEGGGASN